MSADFAVGRTLAKRHVRGKIAGRVHVGFCEEEWRYVLYLAQDVGVTISDVIRGLVTAHRLEVEQDFRDGETPPWKEDTVLQRFSHVEITD